MHIRTSASARRVSALYLVIAASLLAASCTLAVGRSVEQRDITLHVYGSGSRAVLLIGGLHTGSEDNTRLMAERIAAWFAANPRAIPPSITLFIVPSANPDGTASGAHTNARGVDLNRNWPTSGWTRAHGGSRYWGGPRPASEPETKAMIAFLDRVRQITSAGPCPS